MEAVPLTVETIDRVAPRPAAPGLAPGAVLGDWRIEQQIGEGGMGTVYAAVHVEIGKRAALKVIRTRLADSLHAAERFLQEARVVNQIQHPNIVDIFALGRLDDGRPYLVMELLHGESLGDRLERGRVPSLEAIDLLLQVCEALAAAHACGVVHRDLKPDNIFLAGATVKLLDWGIAKMKDRPAELDITGAGSMVGTPRYVAPEQARGLEVDERTDVYSLGCIAHELFLEAPPFAADNVADLLVAHLREPVAPPSEVWPDIPPVLERMIVGMLEKDAGRRITLPEVVDALEQARVELGTRLAAGSGAIPRRTRPPTNPPRITPPASPAAEAIGTEATQLSDAAVPPRRRSPWPGLIAATVVVAVLAITARALVHYQPLRAPVSELRLTPILPLRAEVPAARAAAAAATSSPAPVLLPPADPAAPLPAITAAHADEAKASSPRKASPRARRVRIHPDATIDPFARE